MLFNSQPVLISKAINDKVGVHEVFFHQVRNQTRGTPYWLSREVNCCLYSDWSLISIIFYYWFIIFTYGLCIMVKT